MRKKCPNILKRMGAILLAFMCLMMPMSAFAAESNSTIDDQQKGSITVYKYNSTEANKAGIDTTQWKATGKENTTVQNAMKDYAIEGVEFTYAKVAEISTDTVDGKVQVVYTIDQGLATALGVSETKLTSTAINKALTDKLTANTSGTKTDLETYLKTKQAKTITTNADGYAKVDNLDLGLYLMVETKFPNNISVSVNPFFVSIPMTEPEGNGWFYNVTVYPKNQTDTPTVDKLVRQDADTTSTAYKESATGSIGDKMDYIFVSKLPKITASTPLDKYTFTDTADKGLTYNEDAAIYFYNNEADAKANTIANAKESWTGDEATTYFTQSISTTADSNTMTIVPTTEGYNYINRLDTTTTDYYMVVAYSATINENAVVGDKGNNNEVTLEWKRTSSATSETLTDEAEVYTYGLNVTKTFEGGSASADATQVQFILQNITDDYYVTAETISDGNYKVTKNTTATKEDATKFSPSSEGKLLIDGLEPDTYELTEVRTAGGFSLLKDPITIVIRKDGTTSASATINGSDTNMSAAGDSENARVDLTVINHANFTLPMTGGAGTLLFTLAGCIVGLMAIVLITGKKKTE